MRPKKSISRSNQAGPAGLMADSEAGPVVAVEVIIKEDDIPPVRILLKLLCTAVEEGPTAPAGVGIHL
jgi:hypothetical protein